MVTLVMAPSRAPLTPSSPAMAPEGTRMRQPCFSASRAHSSSTPISAPTESTIRCFPAASTVGPNSRSATRVAASTIRSERPDQRVERIGRIAGGGGGVAHGDARQRHARNVAARRLRDGLADDAHADDTVPEHWTLLARS